MSRTFRCKKSVPTGLIVRDGYETKAYDKNNKVYFGDLTWYAVSYYRGGFQSIFGFVGDWTSEELTAI